MLNWFSYWLIFWKRSTPTSRRWRVWPTCPWKRGSSCLKCNSAVISMKSYFQILMSSQHLNRLFHRARYFSSRCLFLTSHSLQLSPPSPIIARLFSSTPSYQCQVPPTIAKTELSMLHSHSLKVPSFGGSLWVSSPFNVSVKPIGTMEHPNLDKAFVKVSSEL